MAIDLFSIGPFTVHGYGFMIGLGFLVAILLGSRLAKKFGLSDDHFVNVALCVLVFGFLGGKILYIIVNFGSFLKNPIGALGSEGFVVYGGIVTAVITIVIYCKIKKISAFDYLDMITMMGALNQAFGRVGCFMAGCCHGKRTDSFLGVVFPANSLCPVRDKVIPTQLIMAAMDLALFLILYYIFSKRRIKKGFGTDCYMVLYSIGRFLIEFIRDDADRGYVGALSTSQFIAIWVLLAALIYLWVLFKKLPEKVTAVSEIKTEDAETASVNKPEDSPETETE